MTNTLLQRFEDHLGDKPSSRHFLHYASHFLDSLGGQPITKEAIEDYIGSLKMKPGSKRLVFGIIRNLCRVNNIPWPLRQGDGPKVLPLDEDRPALYPETIQDLIGHRNEMAPPEACFLALSTTYGLRREEMCNLQPEHIKLEQQPALLFISTAKGGRQRWHMVPPEIAPYIAAHDFRTTYTPLRMSALFWLILYKAGYAERLAKERLGWHSIRRTLNTVLIDAGLSPLAVAAFMRWKIVAGDLAMPAHYYATKFVGRDEQKVVGSEALSDTKVFEKHPFVPCWRQ